MINCENHHADLLRSGLAECMVLLKKNGAFPLKRPCRLAAFGNGVRRSVKGGTGSGDVNAHIVVNVEQGLRNAGFQLIGSDWLDGFLFCLVCCLFKLPLCSFDFHLPF